MTTFTVQIKVSSNRVITSDQVHQALCEFLHEECVNFTDVSTQAVLEFTDVGKVKLVTK